MKNQYLGDIGDYGKYGLLRFLAKKGVKIGVNWYLTKCDPTVNHGNDNKYLEKSDNRVYDEELFDAMKSLAHKERKSVADIKARDLIPNAIYFDEMLSTDERPAKERKAARDRWHGRALAALFGTQLVFADPDVGTRDMEKESDRKRVSHKGGEHYALTSELADYYGHGQDVVYYCHRARRREEAWNEKKAEMKKLLPDAALFVLTFRRGMQRSYLFAVHPERAGNYRRLIDGFLATAWGLEKGGGGRAPFADDPVK